MKKIKTIVCFLTVLMFFNPITSFAGTINKTTESDPEPTLIEVHYYYYHHIPLMPNADNCYGAYNVITNLGYSTSTYARGNQDMYISLKHEKPKKEEFRKSTGKNNFFIGKDNQVGKINELTDQDPVMGMGMKRDFASAIANQDIERSDVRIITDFALHHRIDDPPYISGNLIIYEHHIFLYETPYAIKGRVIKTNALGVPDLSNREDVTTIDFDRKSLTSLFVGDPDYIEKMLLSIITPTFSYSLGYGDRTDIWGAKINVNPTTGALISRFSGPWIDTSVFGDPRDRGTVKKIKEVKCSDLPSPGDRCFVTVMSMPNNMKDIAGWWRMFTVRIMNNVLNNKNSYEITDDSIRAEAVSRDAEEMAALASSKWILDPVAFYDFNTGTYSGSAGVIYRYSDWSGFYRTDKMTDEYEVASYYLAKDTWDAFVKNTGYDKKKIDEVFWKDIASTKESSIGFRFDRDGKLANRKDVTMPFSVEDSTVQNEGRMGFRIAMTEVQKTSLDLYETMTSRPVESMVSAIDNKVYNYRVIPPTKLSIFNSLIGISAGLWASPNLPKGFDKNTGMAKFLGNPTDVSIQISSTRPDILSQWMFQRAQYILFTGDYTSPFLFADKTPFMRRAKSNVIENYNGKYENAPDFITMEWQDMWIKDTEVQTKPNDLKVQGFWEFWSTKNPGFYKLITAHGSGRLLLNIDKKQESISKQNIFYDKTLLREFKTVQKNPNNTVDRKVAIKNNGDVYFDGNKNRWGMKPLLEGVMSGLNRLPLDTGNERVDRQQARGLAQVNDGNAPFLNYIAGAGKQRFLLDSNVSFTKYMRSWMSYTPMKGDSVAKTDGVSLSFDGHKMLWKFIPLDNPSGTAWQNWVSTTKQIFK